MYCNKSFPKFYIFLILSSETCFGGLTCVRLFGINAFITNQWLWIFPEAGCIIFVEKTILQLLFLVFQVTAQWWNLYFKDNFLFRCSQSFLKLGQPRPLFHLFLVFSNKHHYNFYNRSMWKNVMSIQYMAPGFKPPTFGMWASSHYH